MVSPSFVHHTRTANFGMEKETGKPGSQYRKDKAVQSGWNPAAGYELTVAEDHL